MVAVLDAVGSILTFLLLSDTALRLWRGKEFKAQVSQSPSEDSETWVIQHIEIPHVKERGILAADVRCQTIWQMSDRHAKPLGYNGSLSHVNHIHPPGRGKTKATYRTSR